MKKVSVISTRAPVPACRYWKVVARMSAANERGHVVEQAAHVEVADDHAGDGEAGGRQAHGKFVRRRRRQRDERGKPVHQERLGGNLDAGALRQYHAAAVDNVEDGDGLARLALGVERIAAEIYEIESDADDQQDRPRVTRLSDIVEPSGRSGSLGIGARGLFRKVQVKLPAFAARRRNLTANPCLPSREGEQSKQGAETTKTSIQF